MNPVVAAIRQKALIAYQSSDARTTVKLCEQGLKLERNSPFFLKLAGWGSSVLGEQSRAKTFFKKLLEVTPQDPDAPYNLGLLAEQNQELQAAAHYYESALKMDAIHRGALTNYGRCLIGLGQYEAAKKVCTQVFEAHGDTMVLNNLGVIALHLNQPEKAAEIFSQVLSKHPSFTDAAMNLSGALLMSGKFRDGWLAYEARFGAAETETVKRFQTMLPRWNFGAGQRVLVWGEQGIGDVIMFGMTLKEVADYTTELTVVVDKRLATLFARSLPDGVKIASFSDTSLHTTADYQIPIGSLMSHFRGKREAFSASSRGYLTADPNRVEHWRETLKPDGKKRLVGISWHTSNPETGGRRSCDPAAILKAVRRTGDRFVTLQYGNHSATLKKLKRKGFDIDQPEGVDNFNDLDELAAVIASCDLVVTIDNSTVHLAGALGVPTILLLPNYCDWRWGTKDEHSFLYDSATLIRQSAPGDWGSVMTKLAQYQNGERYAPP